MDDYKLLHMLAEGPLGQTLLVRDKSSGERRVIKQAECRDYTQAMLAYQQVLQLKRLNSHPSICPYHQFFVHWDREAHAVFLCTVSDYQELGNLSSFIECQRVKKESVDEQLLKEWMVQLVEGLGHAHSNDLLHRDLKPSNILLSSPTSLLLGDFAVPVVMSNLKEVILKRGGSLQWLSPEELAGGGMRGEGGSEKGDVWSLGCVMLELATCGYLDGSHYTVLLHRLHRDPCVLDEALDEIRKLYCGDLCHVLELCLRRSVEQRPSSNELMKCPAMQQLLNEPSATSDDASENDSTGQNEVLCLCNRKALTSGCDNLIITATPDLVCQGLPRQHPLLTEWTITLDPQEEQPGEIWDILKAMQAHPDDRHSLLQCCIQLWDHTLTDRGCDEVCQCGGVEVICVTLSVHMTHPQLSNITTSLLWSLSLRDTICPQLAKHGAVDLLLKCLHTHSQDSETTKYACLALASLVQSSELALAVIHSDTGISFTPNTINFRNNHREAVAASAQLWDVLYSHGDVKTVLESHGVTRPEAHAATVAR